MSPEASLGDRPANSLQFSVAVFDVLRGSTPLQNHPHAFVLLQPRPRLQDTILGDKKIEARSTYVGMVEETGSLYALSPSQFPFVGWGLMGQNRRGRHIDGRTDLEISSDTKKEETDIAQLCEENPSDRRCLLGLHLVESGNGHEDRMKRLLEGPKSSVFGLVPGAMKSQSPGQGKWLDRGALDIRVVGSIDSVPANGSDAPTAQPSPPSRSTVLEAAGISIFFGLLSIWFLFKRVKGKDVPKPSPVPTPAEPVLPPTPVLPVPPQAIGEPISEPPTTVEKEAASEASTGVSDEWVKVRTEPAAPPEDGDDTDREGEVDQEATPTPGRRKPRRGKRGKKKKKDLTVAPTDEEGEGTQSPPPETPTPQPPVEETVHNVTPQSSLILTPPPPVAEASTSLTVTDHILGKTISSIFTSS